jgi:hypothetical protein
VFFRQALSSAEQTDCRRFSRRIWEMFVKRLDLWVLIEGMGDNPIVALEMI